MFDTFESSLKEKRIRYNLMRFDQLTFFFSKELKMGSELNCIPPPLFGLFVHMAIF